MAAEIPPAVVKYYRVVSKPGEWHLFCKKCGIGWSLKKPTGDDVKVGNTLALLNHAHSHEVPADDGDDE